jgi:hypothetical protein
MAVLLDKDQPREIGPAQGPRSAGRVGDWEPKVVLGACGGRLGEENSFGRLVCTTWRPSSAASAAMVAVWRRSVNFTSPMSGARCSAILWRLTTVPTLRPIGVLCACRSRASREQRKVRHHPPAEQKTLFFGYATGTG